MDVDVEIRLEKLLFHTGKMFQLTPEQLMALSLLQGLLSKILLNINIP